MSKALDKLSQVHIQIQHLLKLNKEATEEAKEHLNSNTTLVKVKYMITHNNTFFH